MTSNFFESEEPGALDLSENPLDMEKMSNQDKLTKLKQRFYHAQRMGYGQMTSQLQIMISELEEKVAKEIEEKLFGDEQRDKKKRRTRPDGVRTGRRDRRNAQRQEAKGQDSSKQRSGNQ